MSDDNTRENPESYPQKRPWRVNLADKIAAEKAGALAYGASLRDVDYEQWCQNMASVWDREAEQSRRTLGHEADRRLEILGAEVERRRR